jgi:hypothetical protein
MRDWKVFQPGPSAGIGQTTPDKLIRKRRSELDEPGETGPQFEIALDMNADQLTLMFDEAAKYEQRTTHTPTNEVDHQEAWRREALRAKASIADTFGSWSSESSLDGSTYYRKATRLE